MKSTIPRRNRIDLMTPAELAIYNAVQEVEKAGADIRLTQAVVLLGKARDSVADYVDNAPAKEHINKHLSELSEDDAAEIWITIGGTAHLFDKSIVEEWLINGYTDDLCLNAYTMRAALRRLEELGYNIDLEPKAV